MLFTMSCRNDNLSEFSYKENGQSSDNISFDKDVTYNFNTKNELYNTIWNDKSAKTRSTIEAPNNFISLLDKIQEDDSILSSKRNGLRIRQTEFIVKQKYIAKNSKRNCLNTNRLYS